MRVTILVLLLTLAVCTLTQAQWAPALPDAPHVIAVNAPRDSAPEAPDLDDSSSSLHTAVPAGMAPMIAVASPAPRPKVIDGKFLALGALVFALTAADVELTQHCLQAKTCYEMNPTLPNSRWGQYAVNTATNLGVMYFSYRRRKAEKWGWWIAPIVDIGAHGVGIGSNIRFAH